jgi:hypothetical protein
MLSEKKNAKITCETCGCDYTHSNQARHFKSNRHIAAMDAKKIFEQPEAEPI